MIQSDDTLLIGTPTEEVRALADALGVVEVLQIPTEDADGSDWRWANELEQWRQRSSPAQGQRLRVVVAVWGPPMDNHPLVELDLEAWTARTERPLAAWVAALGCAAARCADGGAIVAAVERPAPLDCAGWAPESAIADAVEALTRSLARSEGPRRVRVNAVTTPARLVPATVVAPPPPLESFPGTVPREVAGAVRMLLSDDAIGVTGTVVHADSGRSWR